MLKKTDKAGVFKDSKTGALVNKNKTALSSYKAQKKILQDAKSNNDRMQVLENTINNQRDTIANLEKELKSLKSAVNALKKKAV